MDESPEKFGPIVRDRREDLGMTLRELARRVNVSATHLSKVERDHPGLGRLSEAKVVAICGELGLPPDRMLALQGRVASDVLALIIKDPDRMAALVRREGGGCARPEVARPAAPDPAVGKRDRGLPVRRDGPGGDDEPFD